MNGSVPAATATSSLDSIIIGRALDAGGAAGWWSGDLATAAPATADALRDALGRFDEPLAIFARGESAHVAIGGRLVLGAAERPDDDALPVIGYAPACRLENLGDPAFLRDHGVRYAYMAGAMANGIASVELVVAMAKAGLLAAFGSAGLAPAVVELSIDRLQAECGDRPFAVNLIHSPSEPDLEEAIVDLYLRRSVRLVSASAYLGLTLPVVRYRTAGIHRAPDGAIVAPNSVIAKVSRVEVASKFLAPPPADLLGQLVARGDLTDEQAALAAQIPMATDITAEADSGGHTDNRPALALIPTMIALRDRLALEHGWAEPPRVGAAGGIATPASAAAAFAMGAAYVVTGSINQSCVEAGTSDAVRQMLAEAGQADVAMAAAADMFEMGVKVQVLKRGTMFAMRAEKLYEVYRAHESFDAIPAPVRGQLEKQLFRAPLEEIWAQTRAFFVERDPRQVERAERDAKHKMALVFRWYLGKASRWANTGEADRRVDYQVWCGPSMGAFNEWVAGSFLEPPASRRVVTLGLNLLRGAAILSRAQALRSQGVALPAAAVTVAPVPRDVLEGQLAAS